MVLKAMHEKMVRDIKRRYDSNFKYKTLEKDLLKKGDLFIASGFTHAHYDVDSDPQRVAV